MSCGLVVVAIDQIGRAPSSGHPPVDPGMLLAYSLAYLGNPLVGWAGLVPSIAIGALCVVVVAGFAVLDAMRRDPGALAAHAPWYGLAAYAVVAAPITGFARLDGGVGQALSYRYVAISSMLTIALLVMFVQIAVSRGRFVVQAAAAVAVACMTLLVVPASRSGLDYWRAYAAQREIDLAEIRSGDVPAATDAFPSIPLLETYVSELRQVRDGPFLP
jgi:hypothetical protein